MMVASGSGTVFVSTEYARNRDWDLWVDLRGFGRLWGRFGGICGDLGEMREFREKLGGFWGIFEV